MVFKNKRRKNYVRTAGHRQDLTVVQITDVGGTARKKAPAKKAATKADDAADASAEDSK